MSDLEKQLQHAEDMLVTLRGGVNLILARLARIKEEIRKKDESEETSYRT